jgi:hypothetical protein
MAAFLLFFVGSAREFTTKRSFKKDDCLSDAEMNESVIMNAANNQCRKNTLPSASTFLPSLDVTPK